MTNSNLHLIIGGARSGKSSLAERLAESSNRDVIYIATGQALDNEMALRIAQHQSQRNTGWQSIEEPLKLSAAINNAASSSNCILIDCLTLWLSNWLCEYQEADWLAEKKAFTEALKLARKGGCQIILVSNEVGHGIVPMGQLSRGFVDHSGWLHQEIAAIADKVDFVMAGLTLNMKPGVQNQ